MVALSTVLSFIKLYEAPLGGAVTLFSMVPVMMVGLLFGPLPGFASAFVFSLIQLFQGLGTLSYIPTAGATAVSVIMDYLLPFTLLGVTGFFRNRKKHLYLWLVLSTLLACLLRFLSHFLCGGFVWYTITRELGWNDLVFKYGKWLYSFIYQIWYLGPETVLCLIAVPAVVTLMRLFRKQRA